MNSFSLIQIFLVFFKFLEKFQPIIVVLKISENSAKTKVTTWGPQKKNPM